MDYGVKYDASACLKINYNLKRSICVINAVREMSKWDQHVNPTLCTKIPDIDTCLIEYAESKLQMGEI